jgi:hypothetical protein
MRVRLRPTCLAAAAASALLAAPGAASAVVTSAASSGAAATSPAATSTAAASTGAGRTGHSGQQPALLLSANVVAVSAHQPVVAARVQRSRAPQLPPSEYEGMLVAAVGAGMTAGGWLLIVAGGRRLQRRAGRRG